MQNQYFKDITEEDLKKIGIRCGARAFNYTRLPGFADYFADVYYSIMTKEAANIVKDSARKEFKRLVDNLLEEN